jgi:asparagine synthase (glutamine-hydrolysing)
VLREAAQGLIPESILARRDKMGFVSPQELWQRQALAPLLEAAFDQDLQGRFPFLAEKKCQEMYADYQQGRRNDWPWVWRIANLVWWHQHWWG